MHTPPNEVLGLGLASRNCYIKTVQFDSVSQASGAAPHRHGDLVKDQDT
jgi:hypothetical protein